MELSELRPPAGGIVVVPMSREEFESLPEVPHAEWWDGACVVSGTTHRHGRSVGLLTMALIRAAEDRGLDVLASSGWRLPDADFAPDVAVVSHVPPAEADALVVEPPLLLVEVLSRSTRHIDLGRKRELYASGGLAWYWVVDLHMGQLVEFRNESGHFVEVRRFASGTTSGPLSIDISVAEL